MLLLAEANGKLPSCLEEEPDEPDALLKPFHDAYFALRRRETAGELITLQDIVSYCSIIKESDRKFYFDFITEADRLFIDELNEDKKRTDDISAMFKGKK